MSDGAVGLSEASFTQLLANLTLDGLNKTADEKTDSQNASEAKATGDILASFASASSGHSTLDSSAFSSHEAQNGQTRPSETGSASERDESLEVRLVPEKSRVCDHAPKQPPTPLPLIYRRLPAAPAQLSNERNNAPHYHSNHARYSRKVFVGGLPSDASEADIALAFLRFGLHSVDWPYRRPESGSCYPPKGYCFLLFNSEAAVRRLISACMSEQGRHYWHFSSATVINKVIQIRPWLTEDSEHIAPALLVECGLAPTQTNVNHAPKNGATSLIAAQKLSRRLHPRGMLFVGGIPRPTQAKALASAIETHFGARVLYASVDTDPEFHYPKGSGKVLLADRWHYLSAIKERFLVLDLNGFAKRVEVKPFLLEGQPCDACGFSPPQPFARLTRPDKGRTGESAVSESTQKLNNANSAPERLPIMFCGAMACLRYLCAQCWRDTHKSVAPARLAEHRPLLKDGQTAPQFANQATRPNGFDCNAVSQQSRIWHEMRNAGGLPSAPNWIPFANSESDEFCRFDSTLSSHNSADAK